MDCLLISCEITQQPSGSTQSISDLYQNVGRVKLKYNTFTTHPILHIYKVKSSWSIREHFISHHLVLSAA